MTHNWQTDPNHPESAWILDRNGHELARVKVLLIGQAIIHVFGKPYIAHTSKLLEACAVAEILMERVN